MHPLPIKSPPVCTERNCVRLWGNFFCMLIVLLGAGLGATAAYVLVNYEYMGEVFGREVFFGAVYTLLASGLFAFIIGLLGFYDFTHENRFTAILTSGGIVLLSIITLITAIVTYAFPRTGCYPVLKHYMELHTRHILGLSLGLVFVMVSF
ncbi:unnamed protein product [Echinostoma caproni]|uniref:MARVEL domain-containing protein n=1 Tax=Echinostoma caproni TaxID=27848 RepID=A0A183AV46_9TREM|nr:unnamed protein product [Echinostoma caproni]